MMDQPLSVYDLNLLIKDALEQQFFYCIIEGEISNIAFPQSGHVYFSLKDEQSVIRAVAWRNTAAQFLHLLQNGTKVQLTAKLTVYPPRGEYQLVVNSVEPFGVGNLFARYEALKQKLLLEGLFDEAHKKAIPQHPQKIGIITSESAAALQDVLNVLKTHRPDIPVILYPTLVQGEQAISSIVKAIETANKEQKVDLLLLVRGGGSLEDLWAFNEEKVARAIFASTLPIITGIGHETDTTIADYVADKRGATPSIAAHLSSMSRDELRQQLDLVEKHLQQLLLQTIQRYSRSLMRLKEKLNTLDPKRNFGQSKIQLGMMRERLIRAITGKLHRQNMTVMQKKNELTPELLQKRIREYHHQLERIRGWLHSGIEKKLVQQRESLQHQIIQLDSLSPLRVLARGYSLAYQCTDGEIDNKENILISSVTDVKKGQAISVRLKDGLLGATITSIDVDFTKSDD